MWRLEQGWEQGPDRGPSWADSGLALTGPCLKCHLPILANGILPSLYPRDGLRCVQGGSSVFVQTSTRVRSSPELLRLGLSCFGQLLSDFTQPHEKPQNHPFCDFVPNCALILVTVVTCFQGKERDFSLISPDLLS